MKISPVSETLEILRKVDTDIVRNNICFEIALWTQKCCTKRDTNSMRHEMRNLTYKSVVGNCVHYRTISIREVVSA